MKRKVLLALFMIMLITVMVLSVSAAGSESDAYGELTTIDGVNAPAVISSSARAVILAKDGTYYTFPAYYILEDQATFRWKKNAEVSAILGYSSSNANSDFRPYVVRMEIPEGITAINPGSEGGAYAFEDAKKLVEVTIPSTMNLIGNYVFNRASALTTVNGFDSFLTRATKLGTLMLSSTSWGEGIDLVIPSNITVVPSQCFTGTKIKSVTFSEGLQTLGQRSFQNCTNITSTVLPSTVTKVENHVFAGCSSLTSVDTSKCTGIQSIGEYCFEKTKITSFDFTPFASAMTSIGRGLFNDCTALASVTGYDLITCATEVGDHMFNNCNLTEISFPANIERIGNYAFKKFKGEVYVNIPDTVEIIGTEAFNSSKIIGVSLPNNLVKIQNHAFAGCAGLTTADTDGCTNIEYIGRFCFEYCTKLTAFDFTPFASVFTTFELDNGNNGAFNGCTSLTTVIGLEKLVNITYLPGYTFRHCPLTEINLPQNLEEIGYEAMRGHMSTQEVFKMPNSLQIIGNHAFTRGNIGGADNCKIYLSAGLTTINSDYTFENWKFTEMYIPASVTSIVTGFANRNSTTGVVYYYTGSLNGMTISSTNNGSMANAEWISVNDFTGASSEKNYIVYGYNPCLAFYDGIHTCESTSPIITSYFENINIGGNCTVCQETVVTETIGAIFTYLGYSCTEEAINGVHSVTQGYGVNETALNDYLVINPEFSYGLVASGIANPFDDANGALVESGKVVVISAELLICNYFEIKVNGISEANLDTNIVFCLFVNDNGTYYLDNGTTSENVDGISYNGVYTLLHG